MTAFFDKENSIVAYIYNNAILHKESFLVTGLILGSNVYDLKGNVKAKYFRHKLYNQSGEIIATAAEVKSPEEIDISTIIYQAWQVLGKIRDYTFPWINPLPRWSDQTLYHFLH